MWSTGAAWLCHHLWEHYQFSGDRAFLSNRAYPAMKEACEFLVDTLQLDPATGWLVTNPSHSPEQSPPGRPLFVRGAAIDMQLTRALFDYTIEAATILNIDAEFADQLGEVRRKLAPDRIGREGQLQEWLDDWDAPNNNHRHMSPLWGLYPGQQFCEASDPQVFQASKKLLRWRGDGSTGWSFAWRIPLWARIGDGEMAYRQLGGLLSRRVLPNLFDLCGPYQADGNFGATAGIAETLLQSHTKHEGLYVIELLPALPKAWPNGSVKGLRARGGFEVDIQWSHGQWTEATIHRTGDQPILLKTPRGIERIKCDKGQAISLDAAFRS
jgi:alpha-L-fucosidase 2